MTKSSARSKTAPVRIGRSPVTGLFVLAPYPKKGGTVDPRKIQAVVKSVAANPED